MLNRIRKIMMTMAALTVVVTAAHYVMVDSASAIYCRVTAFPSGNWIVTRQTCAPGCDGRVLVNATDSSRTFCYIPPFQP